MTRTARRARAASGGFPEIGRTVAATAIAVVGGLAGLVGAWTAIGPSPWLVIAMGLVVAAVAVPRAPFTAAAILQLALAVVGTGPAAYTARFAVVLLCTHLLVATGAVTAWTPRRARVQLRVLRRPTIRFIGIQLAAQIVAWLVLGLIVSPQQAASPGSGPAGTGQGPIWLGLLGAAAALLVAVLVLVPALSRPSGRTPATVTADDQNDAGTL